MAGKIGRGNFPFNVEEKALGEKYRQDVKGIGIKDIVKV